MTKILTVEVPEETYQAIEEMSLKSKQPTEAIVRNWIEQQAKECGATAAVARHSFMRFPLEERRGILAAQAEGLISHYQEDSEWRELRGGDVILAAIAAVIEYP